MPAKICLNSFLILNLNVTMLQQLWPKSSGFRPAGRMAAGATARRAAAGHPILYKVGHSVSFLLHCDRPSPPAAPASLPAGTGSPPSMKEHDGRRQGEDGSKARSPRIQARSRATSAGNGATGNAGAPHTGQPDGSRDSQCLHARTGIGILLRLRRNGAISPGTLCTPRHAAASSQRKGPLRRAFHWQSASLHPPF